MLGVSVNVGVGVIVAVSVGVNVDVGVGVLVHDAAVAVMAVAVRVACISGDGPQAVRANRIKIVSWKVFISEILIHLNLRNSRKGTENKGSACPRAALIFGFLLFECVNLIFTGTVARNAE